MRTFELYIPDMACAACIAPINRLKEFPQVISATFDNPTHIVTVETNVLKDVDENELTTQFKNAVDEVGFTCAGILEITPDREDKDISAESKRIEFEDNQIIQSKKRIQHLWLKGIIGTLSGAAVLTLSLTGVTIPILGMIIMGSSSSLLTLYLGKNTYKQAFLGLIRTKSLSMESLFAVSTLLAIGVSVTSFFVPSFPMMFDAGLLILGFKNIGKAIEESSNYKLTKKSFLALAPNEIESEFSAESSIRRTIPVKNLRPGNVIVLYEGQTAPVDGICLSRNTMIYNTIVTGKTTPQSVAENGVIFAGSILVEDSLPIRIRVTGDSYLAFLDKRMKAAASSKSIIEDTTTKQLKYFVPGVFGIATIAGVLCGTLLSPVAGIETGMTVLISMCPCALGLIPAVTMRTGIAIAAALGISFKNATSIEKIADINAYVFDLNGTYTKGVPKIIESTIPLDMLPILAKMESVSNKPIATTIHQFAAEHSRTMPECKISDINSSHHSGLIAKINNDTYIVGNCQMMTDNHIPIEPWNNKINRVDADLVIYFAKNSEVQGYLLLEDPLRDDALATSQSLKKLGNEIYLCTGENEVTARKYAEKLEIEPSNISANRLAESKEHPELTKTAFIQNLISQGYRVCMVGDAGNDALAVAASDCGIAMNSTYGSTVTKDAADIIINHDSLWSVINAQSIAKQTIRNLKQNLKFSTGYNVLCVLLFSGVLNALNIHINPAVGAALMVFQISLILLNVSSLKRQAIPDITSNTNQQSSENNNFWKSSRRSLNSVLQLEPQPTLQRNILSGSENENKNPYKKMFVTLDIDEGMQTGLLHKQQGLTP